jgi:cation diffusion facilitator CzcD-associated flavoprotein CzcO
METANRHCIIGAGLTGLAVAKAFRDAGIPYDQFERNDDVGGNWYDGVYDSIHIISSRDGTGYDDWPMPKEWPDFPSKHQMHSYLKAFAEEFDLRRSIEFETEVTRVEPLDERGMSGWRVELSTGESREYAGVVVCNGHHWAKNYPELPGEFAGRVIHSKDYKRPEDLEGDTVLVVGVGNSGCDIAVEAARVGKRSYVSSRRGTYLLPKTMFGIPTDQFDKPWLPVFAQRYLLRGLLRVTVGPNSRYGLPEPEHDIFDRHPTVNSQLLYELRHGRVEAKPGIERIEGRKVTFTDGTSIEADTLVTATGFAVKFPFLDESTLEWDGKYPKLAAGMLAPGKANLYLYGLGQPRGGAGPLAAAGARLLAEMVRTQTVLDRPLADVMARLRKPQARELWGVSELQRQIRLGQAVVTLIRRIAERRNGHAAPRAEEAARA